MAANVATMSSDERRSYFKKFLDGVFVPQRQRLLAYREHTNQSAQVDSDGYLAQVIASIVLGTPGNFRRGKTGSHLGDLSDGTEVKSAYRAEQKNGKEDTHPNFGSMSRKRTTEFFDRDQAIIVHNSYDTFGRIKVEVLRLRLRDEHVRSQVSAFLDRSSAERPQLQPRLYPDGRRDVINQRPGGLKDLGARLIARAVVIGDEVDVDKWDLDEGLSLDQCLDLHAAPLEYGTPHTIVDPEDADEFFIECMARHRSSLIPYCAATQSSQNVGFGNLSQHLVSIVTHTRGTASGARGFDLEDGSEIKLAMGEPGDPLGTEDVPRLNLQNNVSKMLEWPALYPVRIICTDRGLAAKVLRADQDEFREQVRDYFGPRSKYRNSSNLQYHVPRDFSSNEFTGSRGDGTPRVLRCEALYSIAE